MTVVDLLSGPWQGARHVLLLVAHPDDETLAVGGLLADLPDSVPVDVVVASDGQASHPRSTTHGPADLARLRRAEVAHAIGLLAPRARLHLLGLTDGGLRDQIEEVVEAVVPLATGPGTVLVSNYRQDGHPDHEAIAHAAAAVAWRTDAELVEAPIWAWLHHPDTVPAEHLLTVALSRRAVKLKEQALAAHRSQVRALSDLPGDEPVVDPTLVAAIGQGHERLVPGEPGEISPFQSLHLRAQDPWQVRTSWFERRKRTLTLALLPKERYARALEIGCSVGELGHDLLRRCGELVAVDEAQSAVDLARERLKGRATVVRASLPEEWERLEGEAPGAPWDLVVLSEVGYFLSPRRLARLARRVGGAGDGGGASGGPTVVACHWRHPVEGWPLRGDAVHEVLDAHLGLARRSHLVEEDVVLSVWSPEAGVER